MHTGHLYSMNELTLKYTIPTAFPNVPALTGHFIPQFSAFTCTHRPMAILAHFMHLHSQTYCPPPLCTYTCTHTLHNSAHCMDLHSQANCIFSSPHLNAQIFPLLSSAAVCTWTLTATAHFCCLNIPHAQRSWYICSLHIHACMAHPQCWSVHVPALKWSLPTSALRIQPY